MKYDESLLRSAINTQGGFRPAARYLREQGVNISESSLRNYFGKRADFERVEDDVPEVQSEIDVEELVARRKAQFAKKKQAYDRDKLIPVKVNMDGPIGLAFVGDMHLDDDGTDIAQIDDHISLLDGSVEGLFAGNLGDVWNNWSGRLARLYAEQSTSSAEALALVEYYLKKVNWLYYHDGNHDLWSQGGDLLRLILAGSAAVHKSNKIRMDLRLPAGKSVKIYSVHGFQGKSMWSEVYGAAKRAQLDGYDHDIYVAGHIHTSGYTHGMRPSSERIWHALQVASYKKIDRYAEELNLDPKDLYNCPVALIDPYAKSELNFIRFEFDPFEGAERLKWMRKRWASGKSAS